MNVKLNHSIIYYNGISRTIKGTGNYNENFIYNNDIGFCYNFDWEKEIIKWVFCRIMPWPLGFGGNKYRFNRINFYGMIQYIARVSDYIIYYPTCIST